MKPKKVDKAVSCFKEGYNCAQSIFSTYGQELGVDKKTALKISEPFGGGMARMAKTCGAVTGAFMVLGLKYSTSKEEKIKLYALINKFAEKFKKRNNTIICKELLGYDISTPEGLKAVNEKKLDDKLCVKFVKDSAEILEEML